jgi:5-methylcytosine-specific restriction enzyme A
MPNAAPRPCNHPGCSQLVRDGSGRCPDHPRQGWAKKPDAPKRITGRRLQSLRAALFRRQPLCEICKSRGLLVIATQRDHRIPLAEGGTEDPDNEQALCAPCNAEKGLAEALRARTRGRGG